MKAGLVAAELRKLADAFDVQPDAEIPKPTVFFHAYEKDEFLAIARLMPRPIKKSVSDAGDDRWARVRVEYINPAMDIDASVPQSKTCELIERAKPAVYRCAPILSDMEEAEVTA